MQLELALLHRLRSGTRCRRLLALAGSLRRLVDARDDVLALEQGIDLVVAHRQQGTPRVAVHDEGVDVELGVEGHVVVYPRLVEGFHGGDVLKLVPALHVDFAHLAHVRAVGGGLKRFFKCSVDGNSLVLLLVAGDPFQILEHGLHVAGRLGRDLVSHRAVHDGLRKRNAAFCEVLVPERRLRVEAQRLHGESRVCPRSLDELRLRRGFRQFAFRLAKRHVRCQRLRAVHRGDVARELLVGPFAQRLGGPDAVSAASPFGKQASRGFPELHFLDPRVGVGGVGERLDSRRALPFVERVAFGQRGAVQRPAGKDLLGGLRHRGVLRFALVLGRQLDLCGFVRHEARQNAIGDGVHLAFVDVHSAHPRASSDLLHERPEEPLSLLDCLVGCVVPCVHKLTPYFSLGDECRVSRLVVLSDVLAAMHQTHQNGE